MAPAEVSRTALGCALMRARHRTEHAPPLLIDDPYAAPLLGAELDEAMARQQRLPADRLRGMTAVILARSRFAEDHLRSGRFDQYVLLGAELDTVAFRGTGIDRPVRIIEIDSPATQRWKQRRVVELGLTLPSDHAFVPVDFEADDLLETLDAAEVDRTRPTLISWLGVVQYLERAAIEETLRAVATFGYGSELALTYIASDDEASQTEAASRLAASSGEPWRTLLGFDEAQELVGSCGLAVVEHLTTSDIRHRYFEGRTDDLAPLPGVRFMIAAVR